MSAQKNRLNETVLMSTQTRLNQLNGEGVYIIMHKQFSYLDQRGTCFGIASACVWGGGGGGCLRKTDPDTEMDSTNMT